LDIVFPSPTLARNILGSNEAVTLFLTTTSLFFPNKNSPFFPDEGSAMQTIIAILTGYFHYRPAPIAVCTKLRTRRQSARKSSGIPVESSCPVRGQLIMAMAMQHCIHPPSSLAGENV
jgi:hypothetical protein